MRRVRGGSEAGLTLVEVVVAVAPGPEPAVAEALTAPILIMPE